LGYHSNTQTHKGKNTSLAEVMNERTDELNQSVSLSVVMWCDDQIQLWWWQCAPYKCLYYYYYYYYDTTRESKNRTPYSCP